MSEKIGYIRVSSEDQNPARQEAALSENGCTKLFIDKMSGKDKPANKIQVLI